ncbi:MAG TPA: TolC family protein, partial [Steroidobacteraceae bacterium]
MRNAPSPALALLACAALASCAVGPNYHRPPAANPQHFKEAEGWKPAEPREAASGTEWWSIYGDAKLDELEKQIDISNQTLKASEAAWRQATALASQARAGLLPTVGVSATGTRSGGPGGRATGAATGGTVTPLTHPVNEFELFGSATWDIDIWGKIRRTIESDVANAQASEADLAAARLSAQATLASDYIQLRIADEQQQLLAKTVDGYKRSLEITQNQYHVGVVAKADVITAQTQLGGAQSQLIAIGVTRATLEHAIAVLIGKAPADFSLPQETL